MVSRLLRNRVPGEDNKPSEVMKCDRDPHYVNSFKNRAIRGVRQFMRN